MGKRQEVPTYTATSEQLKQSRVTTVQLTEGTYLLVKQYAKMNNISLCKAIADLIREGLNHV